jgi:uncharacterized 2Fe-2S/4Fe-4S cluster protein (DUF4445 family)
MKKPLVEFIEINAEPPSLEDNTADTDRLRRLVAEKISGAEPLIPVSRLGEISRRFREGGFSGCAVVNDLGSVSELVDFIDNIDEVVPAVALDLGTTHLEATLIDLGSGNRLAEANRENSQIRYGADILSRIHFAAGPEGLENLHREVIACINELVGLLAVQAGISPEEIRALSVSGNTTMVHFFLDLDPYHIIREPYIPVVNVPDPCHAEDLGIAIHPSAVVYTMPSVGSYFGGDLVSGLIACGMHRARKTRMLIDVGTNAEVVVGGKDWLIACAGAAGPALEGGVAKMGMRAAPGAIERVELDSDGESLSYKVIGGGKPEGICGSGIIDLVAALYLKRDIDIRGKFRKNSCGDRLIETGEGLAYVLVDKQSAGGDGPVTFSQVDLDAVMRSKAAMYSILTTLVNQVGTGFEELERIYVAGAFGRHISPRQAITLGMLPDLPLEVFEPVGNSSLAGAEKVLMDRRARRDCRELVRKITYLELNVNQEFMIRFSGSRFIPHTDRSLFPSVPFFNDN